MVNAAGNRRSGVVRLRSVLPLEWTAGYEYLLSAIDLLRIDGIDVVLRIPGDGPDRERVVFTVHDLELTGAVRLGEVAPETSQAEIELVVPLTAVSVPEDRSRVGAAVIATDVAGIDARVGGNRELRVVPARDPRAIAEAVAELAGRHLS